MARRSLEDFFSQDMAVKGIRPDYVTDPNRIPDEKDRKKVKTILKDDMARSIARGAETTVSAKPDGTPVVDSGAIEVSGITESSPNKPVAAPKAKIIPENLIPKEEAAPQTFIPEWKRSPAEASAPAAPVVQKEEGFPWDRALIGATPLLVGLLTGNKQEGVATAGNYWAKGEAELYKKENDLAAKLAELQAKKQMEGTGVGGKRRFVAQTIALQDGTNIKATFDSFTGQYLMPDGSEIPSNFIRAGYAVNPEEFDRRKQVTSDHKRDDADYLSQNTQKDPTTGQLGIVRNGRIIPIEGQSSGQLNVKNEKDIKDAVTELKSAPIYQDSVNALSLAPTVNGLLEAAARDNDPNSIAGSSVILTMIRAAQRVGIASDRDAAAMGGTQQVNETLIRLEEKFLGSGKPLTDRDIQDLKEISSIYSKVAQKKLSGYYAEKKQSFAQRYNLAPEIIDQHLGAEIRPYMGVADKEIKGKNAPKAVQYRGQTWTSPQRELTLSFWLDGRVNFAKPENWEEIKRKHPTAIRVD